MRLDAEATSRVQAASLVGRLDFWVARLSSLEWVMRVVLHLIADAHSTNLDI